MLRPFSRSTCTWSTRSPARRPSPVSASAAFACGIGTSEVEMVLATQCLLQRRPRTYEVRVDGRLTPGVSAKDVILALVSRIGIGRGNGHVFEYTGNAVRALSMEQRMTIFNM